MAQEHVLLWCCGFSLFCALMKQLYDCRYYPHNFYPFMIKVILSSLNGIIVALLLSEYVSNYLVVIGFSGFGGLLGLSGLRLLTRFGLGKKIIRIQITDDQEVIEVQKNNKNSEEKEEGP